MSGYDAQHKTKAEAEKKLESEGYSLIG